MQSAQQAPGRGGGRRRSGGARWVGFWAVALLGLLGVLLVALARWTWGEDALARARREGFLRVGYAVEAPYAFLTPEGEVTGESPEIARAMAQQLGIPKVEWRLTEFGSLIDAILDVSQGESQLSAETKQALAAIDKNVHIQVFSTPT